MSIRKNTLAFFFCSGLSFFASSAARCLSSLAFFMAASRALTAIVPGKGATEREKRKRIRQDLCFLSVIGENSVQYQVQYSSATVLVPYSTRYSNWRPVQYCTVQYSMQQYPVLYIYIYCTFLVAVPRPRPLL